MRTPTANPLTVIADVRKAFPDIKAPAAARHDADIAYDATKFIDASIREVEKTLVEAAIIVIVVIFLFLGNLRSTLIPIVTIPLSLIGVMIALLALGYSINLLTLLALVLAIGLVVDDAIVVVENIHRHIEEGMQPRSTRRCIGAREIAVPVISMTITLAAVYAPIGFVSGLTGALFREFAFTLAGAVIVSGVIALTLSPMMCSKLLSGASLGRAASCASSTASSTASAAAISGGCHRTLNYRPVTVLVVLGIIAATGLMYTTAQKELAPEEDQGILFNLIKTPQYANLDYLEQVTEHLDKVFDTVPEKEHVFAINGMGGDVHQAFAGILFKPWDERHRTQKQILQELQPKVASIAGGTDLHLRPALAAGLDRRAAGAVRHHHDGRLRAARAGARQHAAGSAEERPLHLHRHRPEVRYAAGRVQDRPRQGQPPRHHHAGHRQLAGDAARRQLVNRFNLYGRSYQVIPQVPRDFRLDAGLAQPLPGARRPRASSCRSPTWSTYASRCSPTR